MHMLLTNDEAREYRHRLIVAGSRTWNEYLQFCGYLEDYLEQNSERLKGGVVLVSGGARKGADAMVIAYAKFYKLPYTVIPADWGTHDKRAGVLRNQVMADFGTELLLFYDGKSSGSRDMLDRARRKELQTKVWVVDPYWSLD